MLALRSFLKHTGILFSGSLIAQIIGFVITPVLTRIYSPEQFGPVVVFTSLISVFSTVSGLRFEQAIIVAEDEKHAQNLTRLSIWLNILFSFVFLGITALLYPFLLQLFNLESAHWLFAVAPVFGLTGSMEALVLWYNRKRFYRRISLNRVISAVSAASYKTAHPFSGPIPGNGLIMGHILGQILGFAHLVYRSGLGLFQSNWQEMRVTFKLYRQFAIFAAPAALLNILAIRMPEFLISSFDGQEATGFYGNASKLTYLPMSLLAMAVSQVFFERIARIRNDKKASAEMSGQLFNFLVYFGIVPVALVAVWGDKIFPLVLGSEWTTSGVYAQILIFFYFSMFLTSSFSSAFEAYNKLRVQLLYNGSFLLLTAGAMLWSYLNNYDTLTALTVFTIVGVSLRLGIINYFFHLFGKRLLFKTILVILATAGLVILLMYIRSRF